MVKTKTSLIISHFSSLGFDLKNALIDVNVEFTKNEISGSGCIYLLTISAL